MITPDTSKELFDFEVKQYSFLTRIGFQRVEKREEVIYFSEKVILKIGLQRNGEPAATRFFEANENKEIPSPITALQFFLPDFQAAFEEAQKSVSQPTKLRTAIATNIELLKRNNWILENIAWSKDPKLLEALNTVQVWFLQQKAPLPSAEEVLKKLLSLRPA